jgi:uncharacterized protein YkwD
LNNFIDDKLVKEPGQVVGLMTKEGKAPIIELINELKIKQPIRPLIFDDKLAKATSDHVKDTGPSGLIGHTGSDGSSPFDRLKRYSSMNSASAENI